MPFKLASLMLLNRHPGHDKVYIVTLELDEDGLYWVKGWNGRRSSFVARGMSGLTERSKYNTINKNNAMRVFDNLVWEKITEKNYTTHEDGVSIPTRIGIPSCEQLVLRNPNMPVNQSNAQYHPVRNPNTGMTERATPKPIADFRTNEQKKIDRENLAKQKINQQVKVGRRQRVRMIEL